MAVDLEFPLSSIGVQCYFVLGLLNPGCLQSPFLLVHYVGYLVCTLDDKGLKYVENIPGHCGRTLGSADLSCRSGLDVANLLYSP